MVGEGTLVITDVREDDQASYQCVAKNIVGTRSAEEVSLSIHGKFNS